ncbi:hypothetical protein [Paenibacillus harenae]|uniref:hypothetical protein n=1 Tax=Paenibacillus harenae TaxID=306543 RepID=UPI0004143285|nr:hypothetical protein [Paenibacillus harenae]
MRIIKRQQDLVILRRVGALPAALLDQVEDYFNQLRFELEYEAESQFGLGENGYIVLLEAGDNVHDLGNVGLNHGEGLVCDPLKGITDVNPNLFSKHVLRTFELRVADGERFILYEHGVCCLKNNCTESFSR